MITLEHGVDEAVYYMRRPIAVCDGRTPDEVSTCRPVNLESQAGEMPVIFDAWLVYGGDLVVMTACSGSPILKHIGSQPTWLRFAAMRASSILTLDGPRTAPGTAAADALDGVVVINGISYRAKTQVREPGLVTRMAVMREVVVAVAGRLEDVDAARLSLVRPPRELVSSVYFGPYPRYVPGALQHGAAAVD